MVPNIAKITIPARPATKSESALTALKADSTIGATIGPSSEFNIVFLRLVLPQLLKL